ncbi:hypothetical protein E4T42_07195 [Aureobasidium subglaciale]|nr:hypothetical protein E4T42_07195 [Aureobasidium subglaciale]
MDHNHSSHCTNFHQIADQDASWRIAPPPASDEMTVPATQPFSSSDLGTRANEEVVPQPRGQSAMKQSSTDRNLQTTDRRNKTKAACLACRECKTKCDGLRPHCNTCSEKGRISEYAVQKGMSYHEATKEGLQYYTSVLELLRSCDGMDCEQILQALRDHDELSEAVGFVHQHWLGDG